MKFGSNWRTVLKRAWSVRLIVLAFVLTFAEITLQFADGVLSIPVTLIALTTAGAFVARLLAQKGMEA